MLSFSELLAVWSNRRAVLFDIEVNDRWYALALREHVSCKVTAGKEIYTYYKNNIIDDASSVYFLCSGSRGRDRHMRLVEFGILPHLLPGRVQHFNYD